jgi:hypothetical protein
MNEQDKQAMIDLVVKDGVPVVQVAQTNGTTPWILSRWLRAAGYVAVGQGRTSRWVRAEDAPDDPEDRHGLPPEQTAQLVAAVLGGATLEQACASLDFTMSTGRRWLIRNGYRYVRTVGAQRNAGSWIKQEGTPVEQQQEEARLTDHEITTGFPNYRRYREQEAAEAQEDRAISQDTSDDELDVLVAQANKALIQAADLVRQLTDEREQARSQAAAAMQECSVLRQEVKEIGMSAKQAYERARLDHQDALSWREHVHVENVRKREMSKGPLKQNLKLLMAEMTKAG